MHSASLYCPRKERERGGVAPACRGEKQCITVLSKFAAHAYAICIPSKAIPQRQRKRMAVSPQAPPPSPHCHISSDARLPLLDPRAVPLECRAAAAVSALLRWLFDQLRERLRISIMNTVSTRKEKGQQLTSGPCRRLRRWQTCTGQSGSKQPHYSWCGAPRPVAPKCPSTCAR